ncbi:MAG: transcription termination/antitermination protein NusA [Planctomycetes bacterium]|nr:transcription termination/antitermination protein NusA [Planctomycetota bacterium]
MKLNTLSLVEALQAEHNCDREAIFSGLEEAFSSALKKLYRTSEEPEVLIDRTNGEIKAKINGEIIDPSSLGRISFYEVKSIFLKKLGELKESNIKTKYRKEIGKLLSCKIMKDESDYVLMETTDKMMAILPRKEQVPGENYLPNSFIKALFVDFKTIYNNTFLVLSRKREDFVKELLKLEIPDIRENRCTIIKVARDAGYRSKVLVKFNEGSKDNIGSCLGYMGARIRNIVEELNGERIDIISWADDEKNLITNSLRPVEVTEIKIDKRNHYAQVFVEQSQLSQAIGRGGRNVKLASKLAEYEIDVFEIQPHQEELGKNKAETGK